LMNQAWNVVFSSPHAPLPLSVMVKASILPPGPSSSYNSTVILPPSRQWRGRVYCGLLPLSLFLSMCFFQLITFNGKHSPFLRLLIVSGIYREGWSVFRRILTFLEQFSLPFLSSPPLPFFASPNFRNQLPIGHLCLGYPIRSKFPSAPPLSFLTGCFALPLDMIDIFGTLVITRSPPLFSRTSRCRFFLTPVFPL